jgi:hypothetical protein
LYILHNRRGDSHSVGKWGGDLQSHFFSWKFHRNVLYDEYYGEWFISGNGVYIYSSNPRTGCDIVKFQSIE